MTTSDLTLDPKTTAIIAIDMHRGHLDPKVATIPVPHDKSRIILKSARRLLTEARKQGIQIIHVVLQFRVHPVLGVVEAKGNPFWSVREGHLIPDAESTILKHNLEGSVQTEIMPEVAPGKGDFVIRSKKRMSAFYGTELEILLRSLRIETVVLIGVTTDGCVLGTAFEAFNRDYKVVVISDCVASGISDEMHRFSLEKIGITLGWVMSSSEFVRKIGDSP